MHFRLFGGWSIIKISKDFFTDSFPVWLKTNTSSHLDYTIVNLFLHSSNIESSMTIDILGIKDHKDRLAESRIKLLNAIQGASDITFIRLPGNVGDELIYAGARQLLSNFDYKEVSIFHLQAHHGHTAIVAGGGAWCGAYHNLPGYLPIIEKRFKHVIVFPSSFDLSIDCVHEALAGSKALFFAREKVSFEQIRKVCNAEIAHDTAFFFDYSPYKKPGKGILLAYREDNEAMGHPVPVANRDISLSCESLDEFLWAIAHHGIINTDRAHVMIAAALLGKYVEYRSSNYHKVSAIAEFALKGFPVHQKEIAMDASESFKPAKAAAKNIEKPFKETEQIQQTLLEIMTIASPGDSFILVDDEQVRYALGKESAAIPFSEKDGKYWGPPADDESAIHEFERLLERGSNFLMIAWPSFWWLDYYKEWHQHILNNFPCILKNERLVVFDLRSKNKL